jgi:uncharacterized membrane protein
VPGAAVENRAVVTEREHLHRRRLQLAAPFGEDQFGQVAERIARFLGTPYYILGQTILVGIWIVFNGYAIFVHFDPYPFILLNLAFSTQAAYAAPLILLAQTRQAERDKAHAEADTEHRDALAEEGLRREAQVERLQAELKSLLESNTALTEQTKQLAEQVAERTRDIHGRICS